MKKRPETLTVQELEIMKVVWAHGEATVRDVHTRLSQGRDVAYTTVQTMMNLLEGKGHLTRKPGDRAHVYTPTKPRRQVEQRMVKDLVTRLFDGSAQALLVHLTRDTSLTARQRRSLEALLDEDLS